MSLDDARALLEQARSELKRAERAVAQGKRLVAAAIDEVERQTTTDTQEGHRDDDSTAAHGRKPARAAA